MEIKTGANPTLRNNRINGNTYQGVRIYNGGGGVIEDNTLTGNKGGPWNVAKDSEAKVRRSGNRE